MSAVPAGLSQDPTERAEGGDEAHRAAVTRESPATRGDEGVKALTANQREAPQQDSANDVPYRLASDPNARHATQDGGGDPGNAPNADTRIVIDRKGGDASGNADCGRFDSGASNRCDAGGRSDGNEQESRAEVGYGAAGRHTHAHRHRQDARADHQRRADVPTTESEVG